MPLNQYRARTSTMFVSIHRQETERFTFSCPPFEGQLSLLQSPRRTAIPPHDSLRRRERFTLSTLPKAIQISFRSDTSMLPFIAHHSTLPLPHKTRHLSRHNVSPLSSPLQIHDPSSILTTHFHHLALPYHSRSPRLTNKTLYQETTPLPPKSSITTTHNAPPPTRTPSLRTNNSHLRLQLRQEALAHQDPRRQLPGADRVRCRRHMHAVRGARGPGGGRGCCSGGGGGRGEEEAGGVEG